MKAAILRQLGTNPVYEDFAAPVPANDQELITVKAASVKQLDRLKAAGRHYTTYPQLPVAVGIDGAGVLADGTRVYAQGITGMLAEKALIRKHGWIPLPDGLDFERAAALPNALIGSDVALLHRAAIRPGEVVLVNGATGVSGKLAVQMAKYRGASRVIATGRNVETLETLKALGADEVISLKQDDGAIIEQFRTIHTATPVDIVLDYLWGHPVALLLEAYKRLPPRRLRLVTIGEMAGAELPLASGILRSTQIELLGSGIGSVPPETIGSYMRDILPEMFSLLAKGRLQLEIETTRLADIEATWGRPETPGKRTVVRIGDEAAGS